MSLYWLINGKRSAATVELIDKWAGIESGTFPRWRDSSVDSTAPLVRITTRSGGDNREEYADQIAACCAYATFVSEEDADFDCTYMIFTFSILPEYVDDWKAWVLSTPTTTTTMTTTAGDATVTPAVAPAEIK